MKKTLSILITALLASSAIMMTACASSEPSSNLFGGATGNESTAGTPLPQSNPIQQEPSAAQPSTAVSALQPSYTPQPSYYLDPSEAYDPSDDYDPSEDYDPSYYEPSAVMPSATQQSIKEALESIGGTSMLTQSLEKTVGSYASIETGYNGDDQIVIKMTFKQTIDPNSTQGQQFLESFHNEMPSSIGPTITQIRQAMNVKPFTFLMVVANPDGTVIDQLVVSEPES